MDTGLALHKIELAKIPIGIINLPHQERRRNRAIRAMEALALPFVFIDGVRDQPRHFGCSQSHLKAIAALRGRGPFLVLEDDAVPTEFYQASVMKRRTGAGRAVHDLDCRAKTVD